MAAIMLAASITLAASRGQMPGRAGTLAAGARGAAGAGKGAWQLKHWVWEAGFCQLHLGHCMMRVLFWLPIERGVSCVARVRRAMARRSVSDAPDGRLGKTPIPARAANAGHLPP